MSKVVDFPKKQADTFEAYACAVCGNPLFLLLTNGEVRCGDSDCDAAITVLTVSEKPNGNQGHPLH